jgi:hypothetical protein
LTGVWYRLGTTAKLIAAGLAKSRPPERRRPAQFASLIVAVVTLIRPDADGSVEGCVSAPRALIKQILNNPTPPATT